MTVGRKADEQQNIVVDCGWSSLGVSRRIMVSRHHQDEESSASSLHVEGGMASRGQIVDTESLFAAAAAAASAVIGADKRAPEAMATLSHQAEFVEIATEVNMCPERRIGRGSGQGGGEKEEEAGEMETATNERIDDYDVAVATGIAAGRRGVEMNLETFESVSEQ